MDWTPGGDSSDVEDRRGQSGGGGGGFNFGGFGGMHLGIGGTLAADCAELSCSERTSFSVLGGGGTPRRPRRAAALGPRKQSRGKAADRFRRLRIERRAAHVGATLARRGYPVPAHEISAIHRSHAIRVRHGAIGDRPVLLPARRKGLHRPGIFPGIARAIWRARRICAGHTSAHEIGHHVQKLFGTEGKVHRLTQGNRVKRIRSP